VDELLVNPAVGRERAPVDAAAASGEGLAAMEEIEKVLAKLLDGAGWKDRSCAAAQVVRNHARELRVPPLEAHGLLFSLEHARHRARV
jgi:hypothetical protein